MGFNFSSLHSCEMCGKAIDSSDADCEYCVEAENILAVFRKLNSHETRTITVSMLASHDYMWEKFAKSLDGEHPYQWEFIGSSDLVEQMLEMSSIDSIKDIRNQAMSVHYSGGEDLKELAGYEE